MIAHGAGEEYGQDGSRAASNGTRWLWRRTRDTPEARLVQRHGFWGRLSRPAADGAPVGVCRLPDWAGMVREGLEDLMQQGFVAFVEDLVQDSRASSRREGRLIRCRLVIDARGVDISFVKHFKIISRMFEFLKKYFPEVSVTATIVRAPRVVARIYALLKQFLTPVQQRKVCIIGEDFDEGLLQHSGLERSALPMFLGGCLPDDEVCDAALLPVGCSIESFMGVQSNVVKRYPR